MDWRCSMQTIKQRSGNLQESTFSLRGICCLLLTQALLATPAFAGKTKADQARPQPKTQPKVLTSRLNTRAPEPERKGRKGAAAPQSAPAPAAKKLFNPETIAASRTPRERDAKLKSQSRSPRAPEKPVTAKASTKTAGKTPAASKAPRLSEQALTSRLTRSTLTPVMSVKPQAESERRGKFGKQDTNSSRGEERRAEPADDKTIASIQPIRRSEPANLREPERSPGRGAERVEPTPATRPREINAAAGADAPGYQIQLPDKIEVIEYGSTSPTVARLLTLPVARPLTPFGAIITKTNTLPSKRNDLAIPPQRVLEIQYELVKRGFYNAEPNGQYDEATILAMWEFQKNYGLPATGYPSAHALKRLGLTSW